MELKYPVYSPSLGGNERKYVLDCVDSTWISSRGKYIGLFEQAFASYTGAAYATSVCNGTVALHLALLALDIQAGDEVIVPSFTYIASINAITYVGAIPVLVDCCRDTWQMDVADVVRKITPKTKAVMCVHLYGQSCDMDALTALCKKHSLKLIEDCAEAIGTTFNNRHVGTFGDVGAFSFFGNKTITTGEGGMLLFNDKALFDKAARIKNQGVSEVMYVHDIVGYNYRMTNICAAIGLAQLERIDAIVKRKIAIAQLYESLFAGSGIEFHKQASGTFHSYWMCSIVIPQTNKRDDLRRYLREQGIDTRPLFYPVHTMDIYKHLNKGAYPVCEDIAVRGINLPSYPDLTDNDIRFIATAVLEFLKVQ